MKALETDDPVKSQLLQKASHERDELAGEVKELTERTEKILTNALIIGGALALTYLLVRGFSGAKRKRKTKKRQATSESETRVETDEEPYDNTPSVISNVLSQVGSAVATHATALLLELAREKLAEYLQAQSQKKPDENS